MGKRAKPVKELFVLFTHDGQVFDVHTTLQDAREDAVGPTFRPTAKIVRFVPDGNRPKWVKGG